MTDVCQPVLEETPDCQDAAFHKPTAYALLMLITAIWGGTFLVSHYALQMTGPFTFLSIRFTVATLLLCPLFARRLAKLTRSDLARGCLMGLILFAAIALQTLGLQFTTASKAAFLTGLYVPMVPLFAILLLCQWPTREAGLGVALSLAGLLLLSLNNQFDLRIGRGEWLVIGCAVASALHILSISRFAPKSDAINLTIVQIAVTALLSTGMIFACGEPRVFPSLSVWIPGIAMGLFATAFALVVMNRVQQVVGSTRATLIYALEPVWAGLFGYLAGERLGMIAWIGGGLIFAGMIVGELKFRSRKARRPEYCPNAV